MAIFLVYVGKPALPLAFEPHCLHSVPGVPAGTCKVVEVHPLLLHTHTFNDLC